MIYSEFSLSEILRKFANTVRLEDPTLEIVDKEYFVDYPKDKFILKIHEKASPTIQKKVEDTIKKVPDKQKKQDNRNNNDGEKEK